MTYWVILAMERLGLVWNVVHTPRGRVKRCHPVVLKRLPKVPSGQYAAVPATLIAILLSKGRLSLVTNLEKTT